VVTLATELKINRWLRAAVMPEWPQDLYALHIAEEANGRLRMAFNAGSTWDERLSKYGGGCDVAIGGMDKGCWLVGCGPAMRPCSGLAPKDVLHHAHRYLSRLPHVCSPFAAGTIADAACTTCVRAVLTCPFCDLCDPDMSLVFKSSGVQVSREVLLQRCPTLEYDSRSRQRRLSKLRTHMKVVHGVSAAQVRWRSFPAPAHRPCCPPPRSPLRFHARTVA
jgi:hypothetical protein